MGYSIVVKVAYPSTPLAEGGKSAVGHMWYSLVDAQGNSYDYGWAPRAHGDMNGPGKV